MSSASTTKITVTIPTLKGADNYYKWASTMQAYFMVQGLWLIVFDKKKKPTLTTIAAVAAVMSSTTPAHVIQMQKPATDNQVDIDKWVEDDMQANGLIVLYMDIEIHEKSMKDTAAKTWKAIEAQFGKLSQIAVNTLYNEMTNYKIFDSKQDGKDFPQQLAHKSSLMSRAYIAGHKLEEAQRVIILTSALSPWQMEEYG